MIKQEERVAFAVGTERKRKLLEISRAKGYDMSNLLRGWVIEKIEEYEQQQLSKSETKGNH